VTAPALHSENCSVFLVEADMVVFTCPACGKELKLKAEMIGKRRKCPYCQAKVTAPDTPVEIAGAVVGGRQSDDVQTLAGRAAVRPAKTIEVKPRPADPGIDPETILPGGTDSRRNRVPGDTPAPGDAFQDDANAELTELLEPAQDSGELGRLGKYRILKVLGAGGMGVVYLAEDSVLRRSVALKALRPGLTTNLTARDRFLREARSSAALNHDNVVTLYEVGESHNLPFLAMQFLQGEALDVRLKREKSLPLDEVLRIGRETAEGLAAAHGLGLIHRDIKPANLFLEAPRGRVKILDFGLARSTAGEPQLTKFGTIVGTAGYLSPEQASGKPVDARSDLFSLGCVLYRLTTGVLPFQGEDILALLTALVTTKPTPPQEVNPDVPPALSDLILRLLSQQPDRRPASAREVADALDAIAAGSAPLLIPQMALVEDSGDGPSPRPAAIEPATERVVMKKETATTVRPAVKRNRDEAEPRERSRKPRRKKGVPIWLVGTAVGLGLLLIGGGVALIIVFRTKEAGPTVADGKEEKPRSQPRDPERPRDPGNAAAPARPDPLPLSVSGSQWLAFSPDNQHFVSAAPNGDRIVVWDRSRQAPEYVIDRLAEGVTQPPRYSGDGRKLLVGVGQTAAVFDMERKQTSPVASYTLAEVPHTRDRFRHEVRTERLAGIGFTERDAALAIYFGRVGSKHVLGLFDVERKTQRANGLWLPQDGIPNFTRVNGPGTDVPLRGAIPTPDGRGAIVIDGNATRLWSDDQFKGWSFKKLPSLDQEPKCFSLSPDGKTLLTSPGSNVVRVWNARTGEPLRTPSFSAIGEVELLGFSPDSKFGFCGARDGRICIWDVDSGEVRAELASSGPPFAVVLSPDMKTAISSSPGGANLSWHTIPPKP
jgi:serine/threonine protein kinase